MDAMILDGLIEVGDGKSEVKNFASPKRTTQFDQKGLQLGVADLEFMLSRRSLAMDEAGPHTTAGRGFKGF